MVDSPEGVIELVNPKIDYRKGERVAAEGCLSIPGIRGEVSRPQKIIVRAKDRNGKESEYTAEDFLAKVFCHEIDHLDGILFTSKAENIVHEGME